MTVEQQLKVALASNPNVFALMPSFKNPDALITAAGVVKTSDPFADISKAQVRLAAKLIKDLAKELAQ